VLSFHYLSYQITEPVCLFDRLKSMRIEGREHLLNVANQIFDQTHCQIIHANDTEHGGSDSRIAKKALVRSIACQVFKSEAVPRAC